MDEFFKMDVFFFITSIAVIIIGILASLILYRIYRILEHVEHLTKQVSEEAEALRLDIAQARGAIRTEGFKLKHAVNFLSRFGSRRKKKETPSE